MRSRLTLALIAGAAILAVAVPSPAAAATEFGDNCLGDGTAPGSYTLMTIQAPSDVSVTAPTSGVLTKVKAQVVPFSGTVPTSIKVLRSAGGNRYTAINEATVNIGGGQTIADVRLPIQAGDRLGLHGLLTDFEGGPPESVSFYCQGAPGSTLGAALGDVTTGATAEFNSVTSGRVPLAGVIEPDADNDGFGDETQDGCPQSAAFQTACPLVTLDAVGLPGAKSVVVMVATSTAAPVSVSGVVNLGKGKKATLKSGPKTVAAGQLVRFKLKFNDGLTKRLQELEPSKKLTLKIAASATNVAGQISTDQIKAKLKGQS